MEACGGGGLGSCPKMSSGVFMSKRVSWPVSLIRCVYSKDCGQMMADNSSFVTGSNSFGVEMLEKATR